MKHEILEKNVGLMGILIALVISVAGIAEIIPLMFQAQTTQPAPGVKPYPAIELAGRDIYVSEGCYNCHSQMIRPFVSESLRYGPPSVAGESVYDRPFQWGSKRTGPDLARVGGRYTDEWHEVHLIDPRALVPEIQYAGLSVVGRQNCRRQISATQNACTENARSPLYRGTNPKRT